MAVGLGQHERDPQAQRGQTDRRGHVPAAAEHRVGAQLLQDAPARLGTASTARTSARSACNGLVRLMPSTAIVCS